MRVDTDVETPDGSFKSFMVFDGRYSYVWNDRDPKNGTKSKVDLSHSQIYAPGQAPAAKRSINFDALVEMECEKWSPDPGYLDRPDNIRFIDPEEEAAKKKPEKPKSPACQICDRMKGMEKFNCQQKMCRDEEDY
jgi:hypothetical protein